jgi:hypothetical protein
MHAMLADAGKERKIQFIVLFLSIIFYCFIDPQCMHAMLADAGKRRKNTVYCIIFMAR